MHLSAVLHLKIQRFSKWEMLQARTEMTGSLCRRIIYKTLHKIRVWHSLCSYLQQKICAKEEKKIYLVPISVLENWEMLVWYIHWQISPSHINSHPAKYSSEMSVLPMRSESTWLHQRHENVQIHGLRGGCDLTSEFPFCILIFAWCNF